MIIISFNPRSRTGNDYPFMFPRSRIVVSIHVPARGTTSWDKMHSSFLLFQSTFPHGERPLSRAVDRVDTLFQSTFPHGERRTRLQSRWHGSGFNPRSRTGNDNSITSRSIRINGFNPRSRTGNDIMGNSKIQNIRVSIHVPARGTTRCRQHHLP